MVEFSYFSAFLVGLLGGVHCFGMCGGIVSALSLGIREDLGRQPYRLLMLQLGYNLGRVSSYGLAGVIAGTLGLLALDLTGMLVVRISLQVAAALMMLALGLYLGGWWRGITRVERAGSHLWKLIEPLSRKLIPVQSVGGAIVLGMVWGWLPCGLIYSVLIWALSTGSPSQGGLLMLSFAAGTLPNLLLMGVFAARMGVYLRRAGVRQLAGAVVIGLGLWQLGLALILAANM